MSDSQAHSWSDNPNAPMISPIEYRYEKSFFIGILIGAILYGILIVLFFRCMAALFNPLYRRGEGIKWGLVSYTTIMFSLATVCTAMNIHIGSISFIDNREFSGGPYAYSVDIYHNAINVVPNVAFCLNNWLADGLLLYRCYIFYSRNLWVIVIPMLMYLGSEATGILTIVSDVNRFLTAYISLSATLNVLLTLMIVVRLVMRGRSIRVTTGSSAGIGGLYKTIATMLVESSALFTVSSVLLIGTWAARNPISTLFTFILAENQVIASLLIIQRVANKSAVTSDTSVPGSSSRGMSTDFCSALPGGLPMRSVGEHWTRGSRFGVGDETAIDIHRGEV